MLNRLPRIVLGLEGAAVAAGAVAVYFSADFPWWLLLALVLVPDVSLLGYLAGPRVGADCYDALHTYAGAVALAAVGVVADVEVASQLGLIWLTHIGVDRAVGYGLKYPSAFKGTHLQRL